MKIPTTFFLILCLLLTLTPSARGQQLANEAEATKVKAEANRRLNKNENGSVNKVLTTTLGSATDLENEALRRLLVNALYWSVGMEVPASADVAYVDEYKPSFYGFDGFRKGLRPSDFELGKKVPGEPLPRPAPKP